MAYRSIVVFTLAMAMHAIPTLAAELPARTAEAVESRRSCTSEGAGFFSVPGSETCVRISGRVRSDYRHGQARTRSWDTGAFRIGARVQMDARIPTGYGPLRVVIRHDSRHMGK